MILMNLFLNKFLFTTSTVKLLEEFIQRTWPRVDPSGRREIRGPSLLPWVWNKCSAYPFHPGSHFQESILATVRCYWDHQDCVCDWTQVRPLFKLLTSGGRVQILVGCGAQTSLVYCKFPGLLILPPTNLESGVLGVPLPSIYGTSVWLLPGKLWRLKNNRNVKIEHCG